MIICIFFLGCVCCFDGCKEYVKWNLLIFIFLILFWFILFKNLLNGILIYVEELFLDFNGEDFFGNGILGCSNFMSKIIMFNWRSRVLILWVCMVGVFF